MSTANSALEPLTEDDQDVLVFVEQHWNLSGSLPTLDRAEELGLPKPQYERALLKQKFQSALEERGIVLRRAKDGFKARTLTAQQLAVANTLLDLTDTRSQKKKLQDLQISTAKYQAWLKDPVFKDYLHSRAESVLGDNEHEVNLALMDSVRSGNVKAIEYYNEITGRYVPHHRRQGDSKAAAVDPHTLITRIIEIIQQRVKDPEVQGLIGSDLRNLIEANSMAHQLTAGQPGAPQPAKPQDQEPETPKQVEPKPDRPVGNDPLEGFL